MATAESSTDFSVFGDLLRYVTQRPCEELSSVARPDSLTVAEVALVLGALGLSAVVIEQTLSLDFWDAHELYRVYLAHGVVPVDQVHSELVQAADGR